MNEELTILFDFKDPHSYLALGPFLELADEPGISSRWYPFLGSPLRPPMSPSDNSQRGLQHRGLRARYLELDLCRYADAGNLPARHFRDGGLYRDLSGEIAAMGFNWATGDGGSVARSYLQTVFTDHWDGDLNLDSFEEVVAMLDRCGAETDGFDVYCAGQGLEELAAQRNTMIEAGGFTTPACLFQGEAYVGRQHVPFLRKKLRSKFAEPAIGD